MSGQAAQSQAPGAPAIGEVLAQKYRVESFVGKGGMGVVVAARHLQLGQTVAIKLLTLPPDEDRREEAVGRFLHEAQAAARLQSEHVVRIYDVGKLDSGLPFMVMELLSGSDMGSLLDQRGALPEAEAVDYVLQACAGIAEAHQMGIVHRDLKPSNLFVTRRSDGLPLVKVLDFGISKQLSDPASGEAVPTFTNTRTLMGSPNYMSPEQIRDARRVDARTDVWALGIILQELITDAAVFHGESFPGVCAAIVADPPMPVRTMRPDVSVKLESIINRCLEKDVTRRYQSIAELAADLAPLGARFTGAGSAPQPLVYSSGSRAVAPKISSKPVPIGAGLLEDRTVQMPTGPDATYAGSHTSTLESARLGGTQTAVSVPDSRIEILDEPRRGAAAPRSSTHWTLPLAVAGLLLGGALWWRATPRVPAAVSSGGAGTASAPNAAPDAPFSLNIESDPPGAAVSEGSVRLGTTPFSISLSLPEGSSPRVFVLEKAGYEPYVVRQGSARGQVRLQAVLSSSRAPSAGPSAPPASAKATSSPPRAPHAPPPKPATSTAKPPSDIRLER